MPQSLIQQYYHPQHSAFLSHVRPVLDALEKMLVLKENQVTEQERTAVHGPKASCESRVVEDTERDLESGHVSMETVEKRVRLDIDACKEIIEEMNPSPMGKILLELLVAEHANAMRTELGNLLLLQNQNNGGSASLFVH